MQVGQMDELSECDLCQASVPSANLSLHQGRCPGARAASGALRQIEQIVARVEKTAADDSNPATVVDEIATQCLCLLDSVDVIGTAVREAKRAAVKRIEAIAAAAATHSPSC